MDQLDGGSAFGNMKIYEIEQLDVYKTAFKLQQLIFKESQAWPKEETYSLIDQIRRSSRSVGANLAEAWSKRTYPAHFKSKITDADSELQETGHWLRTAYACNYLTEDCYNLLETKRKEVGRLVGGLIRNADSFCL